MATRQITCHVAVCDVTGCKAEPDPPYHWDDPQEAVDYTAEDDDWTLTDDGLLVCGVSDQVHDEARGGDSPVVLRPGRDAMAVAYAAPLLSELIAEGDAA